MEKLIVNLINEIILVAANPLGQFVFSPVFGYWANKTKSIRTPFIVSLIIFAVSSAVYSCLDIVPSNVKYYMAIARFFVGTSSANVGKNFKKMCLKMLELILLKSFAEVMSPPLRLLKREPRQFQC